MLSQEINNFNTLEKDAKAIRRKILNLAFQSGGGQHLGGGLSMIEIMCYLYGKFLKINNDNKHNISRDRFILSKGHGVLGFYPVLNHYGLISDEVLNSYKTELSELISHPIRNIDYGIESSNGSLGHGLSYGAGIAFGLKSKKLKSKVIVLVGDGECNEGSIWEAAMSASSLNLNNLICIVDANKFQSDGSRDLIVNQNNLGERWKSFGWHVEEINGHDFKDLEISLNKSKEQIAKPSAIIANTIKGKGINFMENNNTWHHGMLTQKIYEDALQLLE